MYIVLDKKDRLVGFNDVKDENYKSIEISDDEHAKIMNLQSQGVLYWDKVKREVKVIVLGQFEFIDENGEVQRNIEEEQKFYKNKLLTLKKERIQIKKDIKDFEEYEEDTAELKDQLKEKEKEIEDLKNTIKELEG